MIQGTSSSQQQAHESGEEALALIAVNGEQPENASEHAAKRAVA
jgi:hypothetical protein